MPAQSQQRMFQVFSPGIVPPADGEEAWVFAFREGRLLVRRQGGGCLVPLETDLASAGLPDVERHFIGMLDGRPCRAMEIPAGVPAPDGWSFEALRTLFEVITEGFFRAAGCASQLVDWARTHRFCGQCGAATTEKPGERARECTSCGLLFFPRIAPAIIVAVLRGDKLLMARSPRFAPGMYSVLAGFVEAGETLEECIHREVREETGIEVADVRYFASQPWPFPNSLMLAFTARHASGEIAIDGKEIADAGWYAADALPLLPSGFSVARKLIAWFASEHAQPARPEDLRPQP